MHDIAEVEDADNECRVRRVDEQVSRVEVIVDHLLRQSGQRLAEPAQLCPEREELLLARHPVGQQVTRQPIKDPGDPPIYDCCRLPAGGGNEALGGQAVFGGSSHRCRLQVDHERIVTGMCDLEHEVTLRGGYTKAVVTLGVEALERDRNYPVVLAQQRGGRGRRHPVELPGQLIQHRLHGTSIGALADGWRGLGCRLRAPG